MPSITSSPTPEAPAAPAREDLAAKLEQVRQHSLRLAAPLSPEDQCVQSMPDASPTKWHLAHTTWFFETVVLLPHSPGYRCFDVRLQRLFNSYYESLGPRHPRPQRGLLTRPALSEVLAYREHVDAGLKAFAAEAPRAAWDAARPLIELGLNHEQQHQELLLTDVLHALSCNPLLPPYLPLGPPSLRLAAQTPARRWICLPGGITEVGATGAAFAFDNERPRHAVLLRPFEIADRLVNCGEYAQFMADGGYERPEFWLSDGWAAVQAGDWKAPAYWLAPHDERAPSDQWQVFGLNGVRPLDLEAPVAQLSFYEATAYAQWAGARLPTEFEWEAAFGTPGMLQMTGSVWQWTRSSYDPYPGFQPLAGAVGEYNGKFMVSQLVLRGSSSATPPGHVRPTYRNFFPPGARWQFSGLRLARDAAC